ncbi:hypothetical protein Hbl1158_07935 [Halobaculum sp. CBA1158]|uniref:DUF7550 family protein n=1 Tax=Halobaculum sp. CBA1158 TaxID=2904243 RepID=UPI001F1974D4|nr:hypothetical protein [Halobaculum sp. CBA1158]UIO98495.1 hypothetical protein Hbl1158_07935 [Halobaculum sp. CBA1158]
MADHHDHDHFKEFDYERVTSPMQDATGRQVGIGALIALAGVVVAFVVPLLLI